MLSVAALTRNSGNQAAVRLLSLRQQQQRTLSKYTFSNPTSTSSQWPIQRRLPCEARRAFITDPDPSPITNPAMSETEDNIARREEDRASRKKYEEWVKSQKKGSGSSSSSGSGSGAGGKGSQPRDWAGTAFKMFESAATTFASITILGLVGYSYTLYYKGLVLSKITNAFEPGDPALDLAAKSKKVPGAYGGDHWVDRKEQEYINDIIAGDEVGHYHLLVGEKGTGKSSMILEAMAKIQGDGCSLLEAHGDLEVFRVRLGRALDFEYHEDNIGSLFSIRGPRDASALLDVERAFNKLEKVAMKRRKITGKPLLLIINGVHLLRDNEDGQNLLELIQHRAEAWAAATLVTVVLNSDDYWVYERLKNYATRMKVTPVMDLDKRSAMEAFSRYRKACTGEDVTDDIATKIYKKVGGRLAFLNRVAESKDMIAECDSIIRAEKSWFLNQCGILGTEMDDDVMDQQKYASAAMVLAKKLVEMEQDMKKTYDPETGYILPQLPLYKARYVMTRADFIQQYDHMNIFTIDSNANVRADSVPMMNAFREVCGEDGFDEFLDATLDRISAIESLGRTREIELKDLLRDKKYKFTQSLDWKNGGNVTTIMDIIMPPEEEDDKDGKDGKSDEGEKDD